MAHDITLSAASQSFATPPVASATAPSPARASTPAPTTATPTTTPGSSSLHTNPVSQLDPALGIVVLNFYNGDGVETSSIPTQKQLASYRLHGDTDTAGAKTAFQTADLAKTQTSAGITATAIDKT